MASHSKAGTSKKDKRIEAIVGMVQNAKVALYMILTTIGSLCA